MYIKKKIRIFFQIFYNWCINCDIVYKVFVYNIYMN